MGSRYGLRSAFGATLFIGFGLSGVACDDASDGTAGTSRGGAGGDTSVSASGASGGANPTSTVTTTTASTTTSTTGSGGSSSEGVFVAVGYGGRTIRSVDDGVTWTDDQSLISNGGDDNYLLRAVAFGQGKFVGAGWRVVTSSDGATWVDHDTTGVNWIGALLHAGGRWVAVGGYGLRATSSDGITWNNFDIDTTASHGSDCLAYGNVSGDRYVSANDDGKRAFSTDGTDWAFSSGATNVASRRIAFGNGAFVGVGGNTPVVSTDGGASFEARPGFSTDIDGLGFGNGVFIAIGNEHVFTSPDGQTWTDNAVPGIRGGSIAYGHGTFVMLTNGAVRRSTNGIDWEPAVLIPGQSLEQVTFGAM
jgi:hypothetical protein